MTSILIVDDSPDIAFMTREKLIHFIGGDIRTIHDGQSCLEMVRNDPPDLILLDICMPGIDGFEVCRLLKADPKTRDVPIIFLSATYADLRSKVKGYDLGAEDYLVQPADDLELVTRVKNVLHNKRLVDLCKNIEETIANQRRLWDSMSIEAFTCCQALVQQIETIEQTATQGESFDHIKNQALRLLHLLDAARCSFAREEDMT